MLFVTYTLNFRDVAFNASVQYIPATDAPRCQSNHHIDVHDSLSGPRGRQFTPHKFHTIQTPHMSMRVLPVVVTTSSSQLMSCSDPKCHNGRLLQLLRCRVVEQIRYERQQVIHAFQFDQRRPAGRQVEVQRDPVHDASGVVVARLDCHSC
jgi:hypothetical protein